MRADFRRFYQLNLDARDQSPSVTWDLIRFLPPEAAFWRALDPAREWSTEAHLLASVIDVLASANWQRSGSRGKRPKPIERPGMKRDRALDIAMDGFASPADFQAAWDRAKAERRARKLNTT